MEINDAHCHFGRESFFGSIARLRLYSNNNYESLKKEWDMHNVKHVVLFAQPCPRSIKRYLGEVILFLLGYRISKTIDEKTFGKVDYSQANKEISELTDNRVEFVPFINSSINASDLALLNVKGVKYYEPYGKIPENLLSYLNQNNLNMVLHLSTENETRPEKFLNIVENNEGIKFQVAHCANGVKEIISALDEYSNLFVDTSAISHRYYGHIPVKDIVENHPDKVLFGSDEPWTKYEEQLRIFENLGLSKSDLESVFEKNYLKLWA